MTLPSEQSLASCPVRTTPGEHADRTAALEANALMDASLVEWFERAVRRFPERTAVVDGEHRISYAELNARANRLARVIRQRSSAQFVGLYMQPTVDAVVSLIAILKAGAAYVPIDVDSPPERTLSIVEQIGLNCILTTEETAGGLPCTAAKVLLVDKMDHELAEQPLDANASTRPAGLDPAYVIFTSGSTGVPKGVVVRHYNVVRLFRVTQPIFEFDETDVWTQFHSLAFDFSVWEVWGALLYGGRLVLVPYRVRRDVPRFYQLLVDEQVTVLNQTPTAFRLLSAVEKSRWSTNARASKSLQLRHVIFGGEALHLGSLEGWIQRHGDECPKLTNMYGITETTVHVTCRRILARDLASDQSVIGFPLADLQVYLLDASGQPVPFGSPGEMYVAGLGVTHGYLSRPELSAERFVPNPFVKAPGQWMYRTGDLARHLENGELCYLGRIDNQVQIRGFRVELGEIESAVRMLSEVDDVVIVVEKDEEGDPKIIAYYRASTEIPTSQIRSRLRSRLPHYMLPNYTVRVERFPTTNNGKLDVAQLPSPVTRAPTLQAKSAEAPSERKLSDWKALRSLSLRLHRPGSF